MTEIKVNWFAPPVICLLAQTQGHLERARIVQTAKRTESSDEQYEGLLDSRFDVVVTAMDNVIGWNRRGAANDFRVVAQIETLSPVALVARPHIQRVEDLAGQDLLVDSAVNGFVIVLLAMLRDHGLDISRNPLVPAGGVTERFEALAEGRGQATLLGPPFVQLAVSQGMTRLVGANDLYPEFPGQGIVMRREELPRLRKPLGRWLAALERARAEARTDLSATRQQLILAGIPETAADFLAHNVPESLVPARPGIDVLSGQRAALGLPGADDVYTDIADLGPLEHSRADLALAAGPQSQGG